MCYDYSGWTEKMADMSKEWALKTLGHIFDEADKSGLSSDELDDVKDCWTILAMADGFAHHENGNSNGNGNGTAEEVVSRVAGVNVK